MDKTLERKMFDWFDGYSSTFFSGDPELDANIDLKIEHTLRVVDEITDLARSEGIRGEFLSMARMAALFHDVGRFEQYRRYRTFSDHASANHAMLSLRALREQGILKILSPKDRAALVYAVAHHNRPTAPLAGRPSKLLLARLLRDADKLDIYRVVTSHYRERGNEPDGAVVHNLPNDRRVSPAIEADLVGGRTVRVENLETVDDFKLLPVGWVFDIHFDHAFRAVVERGHLATLRSLLPDTARVARIFAVVDEHVRRRCAAMPQPVAPIRTTAR
ncbi:MAG: HD domain-containing protein [Desulfatibacillaceae bacterium]